MKVVILAGGLGTRISEESQFRPKPMIQIGDRPLIVHVMEIFASQGFNEFIICLGYKGEMIKQYFDQAMMQTKSFEGKIPVISSWNIELVETGIETSTGGRLKRIKDYVGKNRFMMTYGDGIGDVNLRELIWFHEKKRRLATVTAVKPPARFGAMEFDDEGIVRKFKEKFDEDSGWISGGFFVLEPEVFNFIDSDKTSWESDSLVLLSKLSHLVAYKHQGFWKPCDTLREKRELDELWKNGAPWKRW